MSELRRDLITGNWVVIATERAKRPDAFAQELPEELPERDPKCPFCPGNEGKTPPEVFALRPTDTPADGPGWQLRVVPNKYAAFSPDSPPPAYESIYEAQPGVGIHEVIIHSPNHRRSIAEMAAGDVALVLDVYRERLIVHREQETFKYPLIIVNHGHGAGASLDHPHSQLFAPPMVPAFVAAEVGHAADYEAETGRCLFCHVIEYELRAEKRILFADQDYVVFAPYASRVPFELWLLPRRHLPAFEDTTAEDRRRVAAVLRHVLGRLFDQLGNPSYNFYLHNAPFGGGRDSYHWHIEILPKLTTPGGFELGSGMVINVAKPEEAAEFLR